MASPRVHGSEHKRSIEHNGFPYHVKNYHHLKDYQNIVHLSYKSLRVSSHISVCHNVR